MASSQCNKCGEQHTDVCCFVNYLKENFANWTSGNEKINNFIQEMQLNITSYYDLVFEWIPYDQFNDINEIGTGGFATVNSAIWKDGPFCYDDNTNKYERHSNKKIALKCLHNSQNITREFLNEVKAYSMNVDDNILKIYGISQNPDTKDYIMVLDHAEGGDFNAWIEKNQENFNWADKIVALSNIIKGLEKIHQKKMVHRDFHTGNILFMYCFSKRTCISDMGLCGEVDNIDDSNIYGVMPYVAPEVLRHDPYTKAADIYSFGMIMYFVATNRRPFSNCAHDQCLILNICSGKRPEINDLAAPKCYIDLMKKCWDSNKDNRPNAFEISELISLFRYSYVKDTGIKQDYEIEKQFKEAEEYRKANPSSIKNNQSTTHPQAIYSSRLLNPFTEDFLKCDNTIINLHSECLDCEIID